MTTPARVGAHAGRRALARGDGEDGLGVGRAGRLGQGEGAAEARVDVGDAEDRPVLAEALHGAGPGQAEGLHRGRPQLGELGVVEGLALDLLAPLGLDHLARHRAERAAVQVAEAVDAELGARQGPLDRRSRRACSAGRRPARRGRRSGRCGARRSRAAASPAPGRAGGRGRRRPAARSAGRAGRGPPASGGTPTCPGTRGRPRGSAGTRAPRRPRWRARARASTTGSRSVSGSTARTPSRAHASATAAP